VSKRDSDDSASDMEVGMTTAERRRRRRRGGGLRVPSDNVPRRTTPPVVPPVPEDPSLAMSIAYSFTSDASEPIPRTTVDPGSQPVPTSHAQHQSQPIKFHEPMAPEPVQTVIDPPSQPVEVADFEMKTREMNAVDLEALGLQSMSATDPMIGALKTLDGGRTVEVDVDMAGLEGPTLDSEPPEGAIPTAVTFDQPLVVPSKHRERERLRTVALSEDDLEEVREAVRAATQPSAPPAMATQPAVQPAAQSQPTPSPMRETPSNQTQPLTALDVEILPTPAKPAVQPQLATRGNSEEPMSVPEIDIQELAERSAESSGEIEVDVAEEEIKSGPISAAPVPAPAPDKRQRPPSVPPSNNGAHHAHPPPTPAVARTTTDPAHPPHPPPPPKDKDHHAHPPPPPPAAQHHKAPPAPPPAAKRDTKENKPLARPAMDTKPPRGKPWFVDLFDEDYLRTLPFLTPQATQAEAEFVIDAMGLAPGAQVLDVGCGYGRHAMELAARGYHVVGLDLSTPLLVRGGEEAHRRGLSINFIRGDMRELDFEGQFDAAYCLFSTFGYFDDETNKKAIANIARALKPGGRVLIEILNRDYVIADLPTRVWWEGDGCVVLEEVELNYFSSRIQVNRSVVFDDGRQLEQEISVRAYSLHEVGKLMHSAGFRVLEVSGAYHTRGRFFGNQSRHIIVLAERKESRPDAPSTT
jgi:SAM-dependent methyltransferase